jgi:hypothetical protein
MKILQSIMARLSPSHPEQNDMAKPPPFRMPTKPRVDDKDRDHFARMLFDDYFGFDFSADIKSECQYSSLYKYYVRMKGIDRDHGIVSVLTMDNTFEWLLDKALIGSLENRPHNSTIEISSLGKKLMAEFEKIPL